MICGMWRRPFENREFRFCLGAADLQPVASALMIDSGSLRSLYDLWDQKRGPRKMPRRKDIEVTELQAWLGWIVLVDVVDGGLDFVYRAYGSEIASLFGTDQTGKRASRLS